MLKSKNLKNFNKLNFKQKIYCLLGIFYFIVYIFRENFSSLSKLSRRKKSIKYINEILNKSNSQIDFINDDNFDKEEIKSSQNINPEVINFFSRINHLGKMESFIYELITMPKSGSFFKSILNLKLPYFTKLKTSVFEIADAKLKLGEYFFKERIYELSTTYLKDVLQIYKDDANIYYLLGASISNEANNIFNIESCNLVLYLIKDLKYGNALMQLEKALKLDPNNIKFLKEIGNIYYNVKKFNLARNYYEKIIKLNPKDSYTYEKMGDTYKKLNLKIKSDECYKISSDLIIKEKDTKNKTVTIPGFDNKYQLNNTYLGNETKNIIDCIVKICLIHTENTNESIEEFQNITTFILKDVDYYICQVYSYKRANLMGVSDKYLETALNILENNLLLMEKHATITLNQFLRDYLPTQSIRKRINIISDCYSNKN